LFPLIPQGSRRIVEYHDRWERRRTEFAPNKIGFFWNELWQNLVEFSSLHSIDDLLHSFNNVVICLEVPPQLRHRQVGRITTFAATDGAIEITDHRWVSMIVEHMFSDIFGSLEALEIDSGFFTAMLYRTKLVRLVVSL
jgi:hypothetical protein